jgi:hypothetical protein
LKNIRLWGLEANHNGTHPHSSLNRKGKSVEKPAFGELALSYVYWLQSPHLKENNQRNSFLLPLAFFSGGYFG